MTEVPPTKFADPAPAHPALSKKKQVRAGATIAARLTFDGVARRYGDTYALKDFSLDVAPGEVVCLLGPSGCGKSTLLRIAAGLERPSSGRILINDREVAGPNAFVPPEKRGIGLMFQDFALFPHLTIVENVAFGLKALPKADAVREAKTMLARVGLERYGDEYPHILSGGQQQRVALARAIVPRPSVMLMDEPFSGLDVQLREAIQEETLSLLRETRATSMIVTHNPEEALRLGDRIAVMRSGHIVQVDTAEDLYKTPAELFVARLFSEINEVEYQVSGGVIETPLGRVTVKDSEDGDFVILCLRQQAIRISADPSVDGLDGRVLHVKFLGDDAWLDVGVAGFDDPLRVRVLHGEAYSEGTDVRVIVDLDKAQVFTRRAKDANSDANSRK